MSSVKYESMRINSKGMFVGITNLGVQKAMNSLTVAPLFFPADSIFRIRLSIYHFWDVTKMFCLGIVARSDLQKELCTAA